MRATAPCLHALLILAAASLATGRAAATGTPAVHDSDWSESGQASWYGPRHEGMRTTSGERFDSGKMTAAHASLPMGSYVRVTLSETGRSIVVKVNDREPPHGVRCIDLSHEAAARLGFLARGVADVTLAPASAEDQQELAEAPDDAATVETRSVRHAQSALSAPRGRRHTRRAHR